jgi:hypothetical protein
VSNFVSVGAFVGRVSFVTLNAFGNRDNGHLLSRYPIDPENPPNAILSDSADRREELSDPRLSIQ